MKQSFLLSTLLAVASSAAAQDFTPAPVDLAGAPELSAVGRHLQGYVDVQGEFFFWNSGDRLLGFDGFTLACEASCLDPTGHVDLGTQGALNPEILNVYGVGMLGFGVAGTPSKNQFSNLSLQGRVLLPPGPEWAISLGKVLDGDLDQIRAWVDSGELTLAPSIPGITIQAIIQVAPEPSALALTLTTLGGFSLAVIHSARRRQS